MQGPLDKPENQSLRDLNGREQFVLVPIVLAMFAIGLFPSPFLQTLAGAASKIVVRVGAPAPGFESAGVQASSRDRGWLMVDGSWFMGTNDPLAINHQP